MVQSNAIDTNRPCHTSKSVSSFSIYPMTVFTRIKTALLQILAILPFRNGSFISSLGSKEAITTDCQQGLAKVSDSSNWDKT